MAGVTGSGNPACGHPVPPGSRFCPVCGQPTAGRVAPPQPSTAPLPVIPASPPPSVSPMAAPVAQPESTPWDSWYAPRRPPPPPSGPQPWPMPPDSVPPPPADPDATRVDGPGLLPYSDPATAMLGDLRQAPASGGPRRP